MLILSFCGFGVGYLEGDGAGAGGQSGGDLAPGVKSGYTFSFLSLD